MQAETIKNDEVFLTSSTRLATALLSLGQTLRRPPVTRQVRRDGKTIVTFLFEPGDCGRIASAWTRLEEADPGSETPEALSARIKWLREIVADACPVASAYANGAWRELALMIVKATPRMVEIHGRDTLGFVREDATPDDLRRMRKYL